MNRDLKHEIRTDFLDYISYYGVFVHPSGHLVTQIAKIRILEFCQILVCTRHSTASPIHQITISKHEWWQDGEVFQRCHGPRDDLMQEVMLYLRSGQQVTTVWKI